MGKNPDIFPKKEYKRTTSTWKGARRRQPPGKCKLKSHEIRLYTHEDGQHVKKAYNNKCSPGWGGNRNLTHSWWECKMGQMLWKTARQFLKALNAELLYDSAIPLPGVQPRELKTYVYTKTCKWMLLWTLFITSKRRKQPRCSSTDGWINKMWSIHTMEYIGSKKKWSNGFFSYETSSFLLRGWCVHVCVVSRTWHKTGA